MNAIIYYWCVCWRRKKDFWQFISNRKIGSVDYPSLFSIGSCFPSLLLTLLQME